MAHFLIATTPLVGCVTPALSIAPRLVGRGHQIWWYTGARFRAQVEATGARFVPMHTALDPGEVLSEDGRSRLARMTHAKWISRRTFIERSAGSLPAIEAILAEFPADVLLSDMGFTGIQFIHERGGPPYALFNESVLGLPSHDTAPYGLGLPPDASALGRLRNRLLYLVVDRVVLRDVTPPLDKVRANIELPRQGRAMSRTIGSPYLLLQGTLPAFEYPRGDLPPQVHFVGPFLPPPPPWFTPPRWWDELEAGQPVIHVTQGALAGDFGDLMAPTLRAMADEDVLVVATTGGSPIEAVAVDPMPANVRLEPFIPYHYLLPYVDVMVTTGGVGGVQMALANGVPLVVAGNTQERCEVAARVAWSGAGVNLRAGRVTARQVRCAVRQVLTNPGYKERAAKIQAEMARCDAPARAARLLEQLAATGQPVLRKSGSVW